MKFLKALFARLFRRPSPAVAAPVAVAPAASGAPQPKV